MEILNFPDMSSYIKKRKLCFWLAPLAPDIFPRSRSDVLTEPRKNDKKKLVNRGSRHGYHIPASSTESLRESTPSDRLVDAVLGAKGRTRSCFPLRALRVDDL